MSELDNPNRIEELRTLVQNKASIRRLYLETYDKFAETVKRAPKRGEILEIGSGPSFLKEILPEVVTSDVLPYAGLDRIVDATKMPFADGALRAIFMMNVFHHIPDVAKFLEEATRCLLPGGRLFIADQHVGWLSRFVLKNLHHEGFDAGAKQWNFSSTGPLSGANGALAWIVFQRDLAEFERRFPNLKLRQYKPHSPFRYWLAGGLKKWTLLPGAAFDSATKLEKAVSWFLPGSDCFVDIEIERV